MKFEYICGGWGYILYLCLH